MQISQQKVCTHAIKFLTVKTYLTDLFNPKLRLHTFAALPDLKLCSPLQTLTHDHYHPPLTYLIFTAVTVPLAEVYVCTL